MKRSTTILYLSMIVAFSLTPAGKASAFHEGGVGYCEGCHVLHGSEGVETGGANPALLKGSDPSSTCLGCHGQGETQLQVLSSDGSAFTPGGDFYWLEKTFVWEEAGRQFESQGRNHGHSIVAADFGLIEDGILQTAPGGDYPSSALGCISCHDPHGMISAEGNPAAISASGSYGEAPPTDGSVQGNFRLLGGVGYDGGGQAFVFAFPAPVAVAPSPSTGAERDDNHTAYGTGMSEWCGNCHAELLYSQDAAEGGKHPAGNGATLTPEITASYNAYLRTGSLSNSAQMAYLSLVPFEEGTDDTSILDPAGTAGPGESGTANVMCLTCHRAHASAFGNSGRWDFTATLIADSHPRPGDIGSEGDDALNSYYGRNLEAEFGPFQRQLCAKCHPHD